MPTTTPCRIVVGALLGLVLGSASARAQLTAEPSSVSATVAQHETTMRSVTLTNTGSEPLTFCVTFDRPLQRTAGRTRLAADAAGGGTPCGDYGEVLYRYDEEDLENDTDFGGWDPYGITMTPDGRLFTSESGGLNRTFELTSELEYVGSFEHPHVAELTTFSSTRGIGFDPQGASGGGTLWWMNGERESVSGQIVTRRILLLEGDLDGEPTGRRIEIAPPDAPIDTFNPAGVAYDVATDLFYFSAILGDRGDPENWKLWAVDRAGTVPEGYPLRPEPYPDGIFNFPDAYGGAEGGPEGVRVEYGAYPPFGPGNDRIVVVDRWGESQGEALETPVPPELFAAGGAGIRGNPLRSRTDPNGVMYMTFVNFDDAGIVGVRPHALPPSWLVVDSDAGPEAAWNGTLAPGESREVALTFRAGAREVGSYTSALQAFDAETGAAVVVPLSLAVTQGTDAEDAAPPRAAGLAVYPNPSRGGVTVALTLSKAAEVRIVVYDVLGREISVLVDERRQVGTHEVALDVSALPSGVYLVRVETDSHRLAERLTVVN